MNAQRDAQQASAAGLGNVDFRLLGPLEALVEGEPVSLGAPKQRALLAHLLLRANEAVPVERLVDALWPEEPPASARHAVQVYVSRLRRALGSYRIEARSRAYLLRVSPDQVDLIRFRRLVAEAREALAGDEAGVAAERVRDALELWRARPLADLHDEPGVDQLVLELEEERAGAIELRIEAELEAGRGAELGAELERLVAEYPAREQLHGQLMLALFRAGRQTEALEAYERARQALLNELGLEPGPRLQELAAAIRRHDPALRPESPELRARLHLPAQPNEFIGREQDVDAIVELIAARSLRLVTLTGTGGIGKTRLALAAAERLAAQFPDGVWFIDLAAVFDPALVVPAVAQVLGVKESSEQPLQASLERHLADKRLLLVIDNFEQVADAAPSLSRLLRGAPGLTVLATSRAPLHLFGEQEYNVPPLAIPDVGLAGDLRSLAAFEAVRLFVTRARAVSQRFELNESNAREIADICVSLGGLPLAIELAGATLKDSSPGELRERLERSLHFLVGGPVDAPARQQTMRATIAWSHGLLEAAEQRLFARLAVFSGGWTPEAASDVCGATPASLGSVCEKGLINSDGQRFSMLTPIREFALEQLTTQEAQALARKHADYFTRLAESADARARTHGRDREFLDDLGRDYENFRAALRWAHDTGDMELVARLAAGLGQYWHMRGPFTEARTWLEAALEASLNDAGLLARVAFALGGVCMQQGNYVQQRSALGRALPLFRSTGDREMEARCLGNLGGAALQLRDYSPAREFLTESQRLARELGNELMLARLANVLGNLELAQERLGEAERRFEESLTASERMRDREGAAIAISNLGFIALRMERVDDAAARCREGLQLADALQHPVLIANCMVGLGAVAARIGNLVRAGRLLGIAQSLVEGSGAELTPYLSSLEKETRAVVEDGIGTEAAAEAFAMGRSQRRREALAYAWE